jgi:hypothetical protein
LYRYDEVTRALLAKDRGGKKRNIPTSEVPSDYKPKPGTLASTRPHRATMKNGVGKKINQAAREFIEDPEVNDKPLIMVGGNAWWGQYKLTSVDCHIFENAWFRPLNL